MVQDEPATPVTPTTAPLTPKKVGSLRDRIAAFEKSPAKSDELKTPTPLSPRRIPTPATPPPPPAAASPSTPETPSRPPPLAHKPSPSASSLAALLSPTLPAPSPPPTITSFARDSVATDADFGDISLDDPPVRLDDVAEEKPDAAPEVAPAVTPKRDSLEDAATPVDLGATKPIDLGATTPVDLDGDADADAGEAADPDASFATVALDAPSPAASPGPELANRDSTQALKSPVGESAPPPWARDAERPDSLANGFSARASLDERGSWVRARAESARSGSRAGHVRNASGLSQSAGAGDAGADEAIDWDYQAAAAADPGRLAAEIERGIPPALRGTVWQLMAASKDAALEGAYLALANAPSPHEKAIQRDLGRTFPHHAFFAGAAGLGQENLFNVLKAYAAHDPEVGYCQGLPFVAAVLLLHMPDEEAFALLVRLMGAYDLRGHFLPDMPRLTLRMWQFERLVEECVPVLHVHMLRQGVKTSMFCSQWFLTLFAYRFPLELVYRVFDNILASGIEAIFGFALALLQRNEDALLALKFDELVAFLNNSVVDVYRDPAGDGWLPDAFVADAMRTRITPFMLDAYAHEYAEMVAARDAHARERDALSARNRALGAQVATLEASLAGLNDEHVRVLNELVKARLAHDEVERELVRYKLLYAESVHYTEDSRSSHRLSRMSANSHASSSAGAVPGGASPSGSPNPGANVNGGSKRPSLQSMLGGFVRSASGS